MATRELISAAKRKSLPGDKFALPERRGYPIDTAPRVRNAAARLEQAKKAGSLKPGEYERARKRIAAAAKKFGIESDYNKRKADLGTGDVHKPSAMRRVHVRADLAEGGSLHVRHMSLLPKGSYAVESVELVELADTAGDSKRVWIQLAKRGRFLGHADGPFELNDVVFNDIVRNFRREAQPVVIDHEHQTECAAGELGPDGAPAMGWIHDMRVDSKGLWGLVEWTPRAKQQIEAKEYKFFSPAIRFNARDRESGERIGARMTSGGITNKPFLVGMQPIAARDDQGADVALASSANAYSSNEYLPMFRVVLRLPQLSTARDCADAFDKLCEMYDAAVDAGGDHTSVVHGVRLSEFMVPLRDMMRMPMSATWPEVFEAVQAMIDAAMAEHVVEEHGGDEDDEPGAAHMTDDPQGAERRTEDAVADQELTIKLREAENNNAAMTLKLKESESKVKELEGELKTLREAEEKRKTAAESDRVNEAFDTYKDKKSLTDADKKAMTLTLRSDPALFEELYPRVSADKRHLLRDLTGKREASRPQVRNDPAGAGAGNGAGPMLSLRDAARAYAAQHGIPVGEAQLIVMRERGNARRAG